MPRVKEDLVRGTRAVGKVTFATFVSLALIKAFCQLAFADELPSPAQSALQLPTEAGEIVGTYRITDIAKTQDSFHASVCVPYKDKYGDDQDPDPRCGRYVYVVRSAHQVALLDASLDTTGAQPRVSSTLLYGDCDSVLGLAEAQASLMSASRFCRATQVRSATRATDSFFFNAGLDLNGPKASQRAARGAYATVGLGIGLGTASDYTIKIPHGERSPRQITVVEDVAGISQILFIPIDVSWKNTMTLTYVQQ